MALKPLLDLMELLNMMNLPLELSVGNFINFSQTEDVGVMSDVAFSEGNFFFLSRNEFIMHVTNVTYKVSNIYVTI